MWRWLLQRWTRTLTVGLGTILLVTLIAWYPQCQIQRAFRTGDLRVCPQSWWKDEMPLIVSSWRDFRPREYFVIDGKRYERKDVDVDWVLQNCSIRPQVVY